MDKFTQNAQNVVSMSDYQPDTGYAAVAQIEAYWEALRGNRLMPKRSEIDPRGIELALEYAFILERISPGVARMRIAGSHLRDLMGMEVRGMPVTTFFVPEARRAVAATVESLFQLPGQCTMHLSAQSGQGRPPLEARMLILPLKSDLGDVSRALGCIVSRGDIGHSPRRFSVTRQDLRSSMGRTAPLPQPATPATVDRPKRPLDVVPGMAEAARRFEGSDDKRRPPYLRLIKSDD
tara:strand:- start:34481 stop:35188 length:708 start_codon:yes stop_codon:yes gene_type:complete